VTRIITMSVMGKSQRVLFAGTDEQYRKFQAQRRSKKIHTQRARRRARQATGEAKIEAVSDYLGLLDSASAPAVWWS
jgi:hypothetical protein